MNSEKLWTSPELLRIPNPGPQGTPKGDIYSFAIICSEIITADRAFGGYDDMTPEGILGRLTFKRHYIGNRFSSYRNSNKN